MSNNLEFPPLTAADVECRVQQCTAKGVSLLLYKNARCDMRMLDKAVGPLNWQRTHSRDNANCTVSIWDDEKKQWVSKEDTGTESNTEAEKGLCSDSFKRACTNWGIGRELYTAPFIWIPADKCVLEDTGKKDKYGKPVFRCKARFEVSEMEVENGRIVGLAISAFDVPVFHWGKLKPIVAITAQKAASQSQDSRKLDASRPQAEKPAQSPAAASDAIVCECCGKPILGRKVTGKSGKQTEYTPARIAASSLRKYGKRLCFDCAVNEMNNGGNNNA